MSSRQAGRCKFTALLLLFLFASIEGCTYPVEEVQQTSTASRTNRVVAVSYALQYLTQRIVGGEMEVEFPAGSASDPKSWSPAVTDISSMQTADLIVVNGRGAEYAKWLVQTTLPSSKILNSCQDIPLAKLISVPDHQIVHSHGPEGEHSHAYMVPYTWLDPNIAMIQARTIAERLKKIYPDQADRFEQNLARLLLDLQELTNQITESPKTGLAVVTTSPHLKYLTRFLGFSDTHLLWFDQMANSDADVAIRQLQESVAKSSAIAVLVDSKLDQNLKEFCRKQKLQLIQINLLDVKPSDGDYLKKLKEDISVLEMLN